MEIIQKYILDPILYGGGYNPVNTIVLAVLFYGLVIAIFRLIKLVKLPMKHFASSFFPYILLGGVVRSLVDIGAYERSPLLVTPGLYLLIVIIFGIAYAVERAGRVDGLAKEYGWVILIANLFLLRPLDLWSMLLIAGIFIPVAIAGIFLATRLFKFLRRDAAGQKALAAHLFEATSTSVAIQFYGFSEQHVLSRALIDFFGTPWIVFALKFVVICLVLWLCRKLGEDEGLFVKTFILALGVGPGLRNALSCAMVAAA